MKKILSLFLAVLMISTLSVSAFAYHEAEGYTTQVADEEYYKKFTESLAKNSPQLQTLISIPCP